MLRYENSSPNPQSSAPYEEGDTEYFDYFEGGGGGDHTGHHEHVDRSFTSATSGISGFSQSASSSKAVLAALRALQDKIRRLETERASALDEAAQLRSQLKTQEIEAEHNKEKDILHSQKSLQEARIAYERVISEKDELEKNLKALRSQNDNGQEHILELREKNKQLEEMKSQSENRLKEMEGHLAKFEEEMHKSQQRESDLSNAMVWETKRHEEEMASLRSQIVSLNDQYSSSAKERAEKESKLLELDHLVGQLLSVNETLICQISGKRISSLKAATAPPKVGTKKKKKKSAAPRAARVGTASSNARSESAAVRRQQLATKKTIEASRSLVEGEKTSKKELLGMHEMYVNLANSITGKKSNTNKVVASTAGKTRKAIGKSSADTKMRLRNAELHERGDDVDSLITSQSAFTEDDVKLNLDDFEKKYMLSSSTPTRSTSHYVHDHGHDTSPGLSQPELKGLIKSLEEEFEGLNDQYQRLLNRTHDSSKSSADTSQELVSVIQRLHKKGEQLRALKSPTKSPTH